MALEHFVGQDIAAILTIIAIAAAPISELRGAIPVAISIYHFPWYDALIFALIGNILPVPFILLFLDNISKLLARVRFMDRFLNWLFIRTRRRGKIIERYERIGLALFVAIPFPATGAWTGSVAAVLLGLKFRYAFLSIVIGVIIAGAIVTGATLLGWTVSGLLANPVK